MAEVTVDTVLVEQYLDQLYEIGRLPEGGAWPQALASDSRRAVRSHDEAISLVRSASEHLSSLVEPKSDMIASNWTGSVPGGANVG